MSTTRKPIDILHRTQEQREQFILVNSTKPLPKGLIYELLPNTEAKLPSTLGRKRFPSELLAQMLVVVVSILGLSELDHSGLGLVRDLLLGGDGGADLGVHAVHEVQQAGAEIQDRGDRQVVEEAVGASARSSFVDSNPPMCLVTPTWACMSRKVTSN